MSELELVGLHEDGEHVVLQGPDGQRFRLRIDEALRAAVRRDRPQLEQLRSERAGSLPPREIQSRIRAGRTAEEVAESAGMPLEHVRRYEGPVLAEREFVAGQARATRIGHDPSAPVLGELVTDRLATRGVEGGTITWDAYRSGQSPWTVEVRFTVGDTERSACWTFDHAARTLRADDDEARWLSETDLTDGPIPRRHLAAVRPDEVDEALRPVLASVDVLTPDSEPEPEPDPRERTEALLDDLSDRRGVRQPVEPDDDDEEFEGFGPQHTFDFEGTGLPPIPAAHPPHSRPEEAVDARVLEMPAGRDRRRDADDDPANPVPHDQPSLLDDDAAPTAADRAGDDAGTAAGEQTSTAQTNTEQTSTEQTSTGQPGGEVPGSTTDGGTGPGPGGTAPEPGTPATPIPRAPAARTSAEAGDAPADPPPGRPRAARKGRASVPSWDEIVFGAKPD